MRSAHAGATPPSASGAVFAHILESVPERGRVMVAVDGVGASGKSTFAAGLAEHASPRPVVLIHVDDFFNPAAVRHARGRLSAEGFWLDTYDYDALIAQALRPLSRTGNGLYRATASGEVAGGGDRPDLAEAPDDALVIVEGAFLHRDELARFWDHSIFLDVPIDEANRRMTSRGRMDEDLPPELLRRYNGAQALYFASARPWERAVVVVDNTDPTAPRIIDPASAHAAALETEGAGSLAAGGDVPTSG